MKTTIKTILWIVSFLSAITINLDANAQTSEKSPYDSIPITRTMVIDMVYAGILSNVNFSTDGPSCQYRSFFQGRQYDDMEAYKMVCI